MDIALEGEGPVQPYLHALKGELSHVEYKVADTIEGLEQAGRLVYREYGKRGYAKPDPRGLRLTLWQALPQTTTFIGHEDGRIVATVTLIPDSPLELPIEQAYPREVAHLRAQGRRIGEVGLLALDTERFGKGVFSMMDPRKLCFLFKLFKLMHDHAMFVDHLDDLVIAFNPKHQMLYRLLGFEPLGGISYYGGDRNKPAVAMRLNLQMADERLRRIPATHRFFFDKPTSLTMFASRLRLLAEDLRRLFTELTTILQHASPRQLEYLKQCYPGYDFHLILNGHQPAASCRSNALRHRLLDQDRPR